MTFDIAQPWFTLPNGILSLSEAANSRQIQYCSKSVSAGLDAKDCPPGAARCVAYNVPRRCRILIPRRPDMSPYDVTAWMVMNKLHPAVIE